ncbi:efflux RND transporter permease subunit [Fusobacterium perfoetens]|uniref:efflux RND transporter permease subunit n=1 Tax=Fusobacterium perfoetens TaxID=852 RepID=UPI000489534C|nr:efflux RND transporter permease subunit [Fusobacterium perfoetens]MCI6152160.1 efflux RND transporter permease subunit [Fusobacterium perfoetens]MDY3237949.1 efflux RND transporter permease subunit [Fusobacterium perfoetens]
MKFIDYSIKNTIVVKFMVFLLVIGGLFSYFRLGKLEDPEFKIKEALVVTLYPNADAHTVELQVTNKIEEALQKIPNIDFLQSVSKPGYSQVKIKLKESLPSDELEQYWDNLRKKVEDAKINLPLGTLPSIVLDDYGAVYGIFLAVTSDGYSYSELRKYTDYITKELNSINGVAQVTQFGKLTDAIEVIIDREKINSMGISPKLIATSLLSENIITGGGTIDYGDLRVNLRLNNKVNTVEKLENLIIFSKKLPDGNDEIVRLKDIATFKRDYTKPISQKMFYNGKMAMGISLSPETGSNIVKTGKVIDKKIIELKEKLPTGINIEKIYYQPDLVTSAINNFILNLILSIITVVGILLLTMGVKSGLIIGTNLVLSILGTLIFMLVMKIDMQRVSLGSFIIAMGMLVDNSIVIVDGILVRRNSGMDMEQALLESTHKPALPLLGATFIAAIAFLPAYLMASYTGEYVSSSFWVIGISLMLSWILCLTQTPVYCKLYLEDEPILAPSEREEKIYNKLRNLLYYLLNRKKSTLSILGLAFIVSLLIFIKIPKTFFPDSDKKGFTISLWAPEGSKIEVVEKATKELGDFLQKNENVTKVVSTIGASPARYYVCTIPEMPNSSYGELIINIDKLKNLKKVSDLALDYANKNLPGIVVTSKKYPNGVPTEYPIEIAFSGPDPQILRELADKTIDIVKKSPYILTAKTDWRNKLLVWEGDYSQSKGIRNNVTPIDITTGLMRTTNGIPIGKIQEGDNSVAVVLKETSDIKNQINNITQTPIWGVNLQALPLANMLNNEKLTFEEGQIWRRNRVRTITVQCDIPMEVNAEEVRNEFKKEINSIELPKGYKLTWLGEYEEQTKNVLALLKAVPLPVIIMFTICVLLFASIRIPLLIFSALPLALIGVAPGLFITGKSFGFMSTIGLVSLSGMMIKNMIVLVDEINYEINILKKDKFIALIDSAISRIRSVTLAALTTILGMIPLLWDPLYGDMAATIIFGLFVSTVLTLFIFPVAYALFFNIKEKKGEINV